MVEMVTDSRHLRVDDARCKISCSMIFKWYYGDFVGPSQVRTAQQFDAVECVCALTCAVLMIAPCCTLVQ